MAGLSTEFPFIMVLLLFYFILPTQEGQSSQILKYGLMDTLDEDY